MARDGHRSIPLAALRRAVLAARSVARAIAIRAAARAALGLDPERPADQHADDDTTESDVSRWVRPAQLLADLRAGDAVMLPPTELQLERIGRAPDANSMVEHRPPLMTVMPVPEMGPDGVQLRVSYFD